MVFKKIDKPRAIHAEVGRQIVDIITSGMYNNPLMVLREYIQNSADSIDNMLVSNGNAGQYRIDVTINGKDREIVIFDNGSGLSNHEAEERLGSIGNSIKEGSGQRGFRGIGRLGGLGYCDILRFETRRSKNERVAIVEWNSSKFDELSQSNTRLSLKDTIEKIATIRFRDADKEENPHFFKVTLTNVHRFHSDVLMNIRAVKEYLSNTAPVPYNSEMFGYANELEQLFSKIGNYRTYNISVNGDTIYKPYTDTIEISANVKDKIKAISKIEITDPETGEPLGLGWFANTSFKCSLPKKVVFRGIRVKHGNVEVGDEKFLEDIFTEKRFSTWHVGEIHLNHNIKPNARRDGFEHNRDYESFLQRAMMLGKGLSNLCRQSSKTRCASTKVEKNIDTLEKAISRTFLVDSDHKKQVYEQAREMWGSINKDVESANVSKNISRRIDKLQSKIEEIKSIETIFDKIDGRKISHFAPKDLLCEVCKRIIDINSQSKSITEVVEQSLYPYFKG